MKCYNCGRTREGQWDGAEYDIYGDNILCPSCAVLYTWVAVPGQSIKRMALRSREEIAKRVQSYVAKAIEPAVGGMVEGFITRMADRVEGTIARVFGQPAAPPPAPLRVPGLKCTQHNVADCAFCLAGHKRFRMEKEPPPQNLGIEACEQYQMAKDAVGGPCLTCGFTMMQHSEAARQSQLKTRPEDQPLPTPNDHPSMHDLVAQDLMARKALGLKRYNSLLQPFNGRSFPQDAFEEMLDLLVYWKGEMEQERLAPRKELIDIIRRIIYASDLCHGHNDCKHTMDAWQDARKLLARIDNGPQPEDLT